MDKQITRLDLNPRMSEAVCHQGVAYLAGQVPTDVTKDIVGQTQDVLSEIDNVLRRLGTDKTKLLQAQVFLKDMNEFEGMNKAWDEWVAPLSPPARATIQANLADKDWKIEMLVTAAL
jgi:enamine deaminase RidA (YjgF/YER057c/UK114 family)